MVQLARALMGLMKDRHGTYGARVKVPDRLHEAVPRVLDRGKDRQSFPMESLGLKTANVRAKPVLAGFDHVFVRLSSSWPSGGCESLSAIRVPSVDSWPGPRISCAPSSV